MLLASDRELAQHMAACQYKFHQLARLIDKLTRAFYSIFCFKVAKLCREAIGHRSASLAWASGTKVQLVLSFIVCGVRCFFHWHGRQAVHAIFLLSVGAYAPCMHVCLSLQALSARLGPQGYRFAKSGARLARRKHHRRSRTDRKRSFEAAYDLPGPLVAESWKV